MVRLSDGGGSISMVLLRVGLLWYCARFVVNFTWACSLWGFPILLICQSLVFLLRCGFFERYVSGVLGSLWFLLGRWEELFGRR